MCMNRLAEIAVTYDRHSSNVADFEAVAVNVRNRGVIGNADQHPSFQDTLQLFPASFQGFGIRPDARDRRNIAIERPVILDDFVAAGVNAWHGIQPPIGMDFSRLKEKCAGRLCLCGGVNVDTLVRGTPEQVVAEVKDALRVTAAGGGYVLSSGNLFPVGTKYENYLSLLAAAREYGRYLAQESTRPAGYQITGPVT